MAWSPFRASASGPFVRVPCEDLLGDKKHPQGVNGAKKKKTPEEPTLLAAPAPVLACAFVVVPMRLQSEKIGRS